MLSSSSASSKSADHETDVVSEDRLEVYHGDEFPILIHSFDLKAYPFQQLI
jgi:hypothetical protein